MRFDQLLGQMADNEAFSETVSAAEVLAAFDASLRVDRRFALAKARHTEELAPVTIPGVQWEDGAFELRNIDDAQRVIATARKNGRRVRVGGSQHSATEAVYSESPRDYRVVLRGDLQKVTFLHRGAEEATVKVGAGCYLGVNPADPLSTQFNSLNYLLDEAGYSLPILGGISHQTISGFMQTGSAGGSLQHGFADALESIELVDGTGQVRTWQRGSREFAAAGVAVGLFGILTHVTLRVTRRYFVRGEEANFHQGESLLVREPAGEYRLAAALAHDEYLHLNWFPQEGVRRVTQWHGRRDAPVSPGDPYETDLKSTWMNVVAAAVLFLTSVLGLLADSPVARRIIAALLKKFIPIPHQKRFNDSWHTTLPCDDQVKVDTLIKVIFTEIWLPLDQLTTAVDRLERVLTKPVAAGNFAIELYGAKQSPFWLSPSFGHEAVRVDVFWFAYSIGDPRKHFSTFWKALLELPGARLHWGKHLPDVGKKYGSVVFDVDLLRSRYPECDEWLGLRSGLDPDNLFVTKYWGRLFSLRA